MGFKKQTPSWDRHAGDFGVKYLWRIKEERSEVSKERLPTIMTCDICESRGDGKNWVEKASNWNALSEKVLIRLMGISLENSAVKGVLHHTEMALSPTLPCSVIGWSGQWEMGPWLEHCGKSEDAASAGFQSTVLPKADLLKELRGINLWLP